MNGSKFKNISDFGTKNRAIRDAIHDALPSGGGIDLRGLAATIRIILLDQDYEVRIENVERILEIIEHSRAGIIDILATKTCIRNEVDAIGQAEYTLQEVEGRLLQIIEGPASPDGLSSEVENDDGDIFINKHERHKFNRIGGGIVHISPIGGGFHIQVFEKTGDELEEALDAFDCRDYKIVKDRDYYYIVIPNEGNDALASYAYPIKFEE